MSLRPVFQIVLVATVALLSLGWPGDARAAIQVAEAQEHVWAAALPETGAAARASTEETADKSLCATQHSEPEHEQCTDVPDFVAVGQRIDFDLAEPTTFLVVAEITTEAVTRLLRAPPDPYRSRKGTFRGIYAVTSRMRN